MAPVFPAYAGLIPKFPLDATKLTVVFPAYAGLILPSEQAGKGHLPVFPAYAGLIPALSALRAAL